MDMFFIPVSDHFTFHPVSWCLFTSRYILPSGKRSVDILRKKQFGFYFIVSNGPGDQIKEKISFQRKSFFSGRGPDARTKER